MNLADLRGRVHRLDELARGLAAEVQLWRQTNNPLQYLERKWALVNGKELFREFALR